VVILTRLTLASATDVLELDGIEKHGVGIQALSGLSGLGLPPKQIQWLEGAGDGAIARGRRTLSRSIDLPLYISGASYADLKVWLSRLAMVLAGSATLTVIDNDEIRWTTQVEHVGGGDYAYGADTIGTTDFQTVVTLRAGDPYFTSINANQQTIKQSIPSRGLLPKLSSLRLTASQQFGSINFTNEGDAPAYPVWSIIGPGSTFRAVSPRGEVLQWNGSLGIGESLIIDTRAGTVVDGRGANRYAELATAPRMWTVPPGSSTSDVELNDVSSVSAVNCTWRPRKWLVI
jgi:hypothetical protein